MGYRLIVALVTMTGSLALAGAAQAAGPTYTAPQIGGSTVPGQTLTLTHGTGTGTGTVTFSDQWYDCTSSDPTSCATPIGTLNSITYSTTDSPPPTGDVGDYVAVIETASDSTGSDTPLTSNLIGPIAEPPVPTLGTPGPTISGTDAPGGSLMASSGTWNNSPTSYTYQWLSCTTSCAAATGTGATTTATTSTTATYSVAAADAGHSIEVEVTASNGGGASAAATSAAVLPAVPTIVTGEGPTIAGTVALGDTLTASNGTWNNGPYAYTYQWERCTVTPAACSPISGAIAATYTLTSADAGYTVEVAVTASNAGGASAPVSSAGDALTAAPANKAPPGISGTAQQGQTLTEIPAHWTNSPTSTSVQWYLCDSTDATCAAIAGATATTYVPAATDVGGTIQVAETATNAGGASPAYFSLPTAPVTNIPGYVPPPDNTAAPLLSGTAQQGRTLTASEGTWNGNPGTFDYQWMRCGNSGCSAIPGATKPTYTLTADDVGSTVAVQLTAANSAGNGSPAQSPATATITTPTTTALTANASALVTDQGVTFVATVTSGTSSAPPSGSLSFTSNGAGVPGCTSLPVHPSGQSGTLTCQTAFVASTANVVATYSPTGGSLATGSTSPVTTLLVGRAVPRVSFSISGHRTVGSKVVYSVTITPPGGSGGAVQPSGVVRFMDGKRSIAACASRRLKRTVASCTVKYSQIATHRVIAMYAGNPNFTPAHSGTKSVAIQPMAPTGFVAALMTWSYLFHPRYTTFTQLISTGLSAQMRITIGCQGGGCPFDSKMIVDSPPRHCRTTKAGCAATSSINLVRTLHGAHLRPTTTLTIRITHPGWIGKYYQFLIRSGQRPLLTESCLAVGSARPGAGCTGT